VIWGVIFQIAKNKVQSDILWDQKKQNDKTETDQKTTWSFLMRRAQSEAVQKNVGVISPRLVIDKASYDLFPDDLRTKMVLELQPHCRTMSDGAFMLEIERRYGDEILHRVCIPAGLNSGACLWVAADLIRNAVPLPIPVEAVH
jgi:hypothetical protein